MSTFTFTQVYFSEKRTFTSLLWRRSSRYFILMQYK